MIREPVDDVRERGESARAHAPGQRSESYRRGGVDVYIYMWIDR